MREQTNNTSDTLANVLEKTENEPTRTGLLNILTEPLTTHTWGHSKTSASRCWNLESTNLAGATSFRSWSSSRLLKYEGVDKSFARTIPDVMINPRFHAVKADAYDDNTTNRLLGVKFDVIIDDCLHDFEHQTKAMSIYLPFLEPSGLYFLEDTRSLGEKQMFTLAELAGNPKVIVLNLTPERHCLMDNRIIILEPNLLEPQQ